MIRTLTLFTLMLLLSSTADAVSPEPGDACQKEGQSIQVTYKVPGDAVERMTGDTLTCINGRYAATVIGPMHQPGTPCWGRSDLQPKPDKWGVMCRKGILECADAWCSASANSGKPNWENPGAACTKARIGNVRIGGNNGADLEQCKPEGWVVMKPVLPSPDTVAIKELAPVYLGTLFTIVDEPVVTGDRASVHATILNQSCNLTLVRNPLGQRLWQVEKQNCQKVKKH